MRTSLYLPLCSFLFLASCVLEEPPTAIPQDGADGDLVPADRSGTMSKSLGIGMPDPQKSSGGGYDRSRAVAYARYYAEDPNPEVAYCRTRLTNTPGDCTNFVSQALWYGGLPVSYSGNPDEGWWYAGSCDDSGSSKSWRQVNQLIYWLVVESDLGEFIPIREAEPGDLIFYRLLDEYGKCDESFTFHHSTMITGYGSETGVPLVSYHTRDVLDIPWNWSMRESGHLGLGDACAYAVVHIRD